MKQGWEYKRLGEVCTIERGGSPRPITDYITDFEDGINWIKIGDAQEGSKYITSTKEKIRPEGLKKSRFVHKGDFILSNSMSFGRPYILKVDGCIHDGWLVIHDDKEVFIKDYLYYILSSPIMYAKFSQLAVGGVVNNLNSSLVRKVTIPLPPKSTQLSIVSELDKINELIRLKKEQLKDYDNLAQSIFYEMFGDPVENEKGWEVKKMKDVCTHIVDCPHSTPKKADTTTNYPCIRTSELKGGTISWSTMQYLEKDEYEKRIARLKPETGDIIFGREGTIGDAVILPSGYNFSLGQRTMLIRTDNEMIINTFMHRTLMSEWIKHQIEYVNVSSTVAHVNIKDFKLFDVPLPPLPLQHLFAQRIEQIERQKSAVQQSITDLETLLASRMQYWFE